MAVDTRQAESGAAGARRGGRRWLRRVLVLLVAVVVLAAAGTCVVAWRATDKLLYPPREAITATPGDKDLRYEAVSFLSPDGLRLKGWYVPAPCPAAACPPAPGLVVSHGRGSNRQAFLDRLPMFNQAGFAVLAFDYRGSGESEGAYVTVGMREQLDLAAAVDWILRRPDVADRPVGVVGQSMGAAVAILTAADNPDIGAVVDDSGFAALRDVIDYNFSEIAGLPVFPFAPVSVFMAQLRAGVRVDKVRPVDAVARISPRPLLVIHGTGDTTVRIDQSEKVYAAAGQPKDFWRVPGAEHAKAFTVAPEEYRRRVIPFLQRALTGSQAAA
jgi:fermentation-respiration switch protein FrsA (DUF1100 family)